MIFAQTERLTLRALEKHELPRLVTLFGEWDVVRWLAVVPFPYQTQHAEEFYEDMKTCYDNGDPQFFAVTLTSDNLLIGGVGLHPPRNDHHLQGEIEIGYWLGRDYWGQGIICEAARAVLTIGFGRPTTSAIGASTATNNLASQNVLKKLGLRNKGLAVRDYTALRGDDEIYKWLLTRDEYELNQVI